MTIEELKQKCGVPTPEPDDLIRIARRKLEYRRKMIAAEKKARELRRQQVESTSAA